MSCQNELLRHISAPRAMQLWRTSSMGHLGGLFLLMASLTFLHSWASGATGRSLPTCHEKLGFTCSDGLCISRQSVCDGHTDCKDGSDEQHCGRPWCEKDEFACRSRRCVSLRLLCDGVDNCGDGSDEASCQNCTTCGLSDTFVPANKLCDGRLDCKGGRDKSLEPRGSTLPRPQTSSPCASSEFQCRNGQCVHHTFRCDHSPDCSDDSDEDNCDQNECEVNNGGCSHLCVDLPKGFLCSCPDNMRLVRDSQCEEVDMCLEGDVCDQLCVNTNGSLTCDCREDYRMNAATRECKAKGDDAQLVFTSSEGVRWTGITGTQYGETTGHLPGPGPVVTLASNRTLYWASQGRGSIYRVSMDGKPHDLVLLLKVRGSVSGLALDWVHQLLYWTSMESGSVNVGLLDGSAQRHLITGLDKPSALAVDPLQGLLFWAQCGSSPKIERSGLDGRDRMALVTYSIRNPVALSLDMPRQLLYWVDQGTKSISRVNLHGRHRKTVVESNGYLDRPFGLAVFEGFVYWSEEVTRSLCRADKHNGRNLQVLVSNATSPGDVVIMHPVLQPKGPSVCGHTVCQHKCVVDLLSESPEFSCTPPEPVQKKPQETPAISRTVPASTLSDPSFAGILSLIVFFSVLLVGMALWWWREEFRPSRSLTEQRLSLKESQDPLIILGPPGPHTCSVKETLFKLDLDGE
uniref:low-density lipoprotein receptor-like n=1 Tax=Scatophagus argus TaxID=75038 RepID=UPI001ED8027C|nr:low-density lipoprotein receptor-like [Scatophagus argus]